MRVRPVFPLLRRSLAAVAFLSVACAPLAAGAALPPRAMKFLQTTCPNAAELLPAIRAVDEAEAMNDPDAWLVFREAARQYFRCSETTKEPHTRDGTRMLYASMFDLAASKRPVKTLDDVRQTLDMYDRVVKVANDLAASTRYEDLRKDAVTLRDGIRASMKGLHERLDAAEPDGVLAP